MDEIASNDINFQYNKENSSSTNESFVMKNWKYIASTIGISASLFSIFQIKKNEKKKKKTNFMSLYHSNNTNDTLLPENIDTTLSSSNSLSINQSISQQHNPNMNQQSISSPKSEIFHYLLKVHKKLDKFDNTSLNNMPNNRRKSVKNLTKFQSNYSGILTTDTDTDHGYSSSNLDFSFSEEADHEDEVVNTIQMLLIFLMH